MTYHLGFTGTRRGLRPLQLETLRAMLTSRSATFSPLCLHHGDCIGADEEAHSIALALGLQTHLHPGPQTVLRASCVADHESPSKPYLVRNRDIVHGCVELIGCPASAKGEALRSGTWYTILYARRLQRLTTIIFPDGTTEYSP